MGIEDIYGQVANSSITGETSSCEHTGDTFINFRSPMELFFEFSFALEAQQWPTHHDYVAGFSFGVVDGDVTLYHNKKTGAFVRIHPIYVHQVPGYTVIPAQTDLSVHFMDKLVCCTLLLVSCTEITVWQCILKSEYIQ